MQAPLITRSAIFSIAGDRPNVPRAAKSAVSKHAMATRRNNTSIAVSDGLPAYLSVVPSASPKRLAGADVGRMARKALPLRALRIPTVRRLLHPAPAVLGEAHRMQATTSLSLLSSCEFFEFGAKIR